MADSVTPKASIAHTSVSEPVALANNRKNDDNQEPTGEGQPQPEIMATETTKVDYGDTTDDESYYDNDDEDDTASSYDDDDDDDNNNNHNATSRHHTSTSTTSKKKKKKHTSWDEMYEILLRYKEQHGDTRVPTKYPNNPKLGNWVARQRAAYRRKLLGIEGNSNTRYRITIEHVTRLDKIGFLWKATAAATAQKCNGSLLKKAPQGSSCPNKRKYNSSDASKMETSESKSSNTLKEPARQQQAEEDRDDRDTYDDNNNDGHTCIDHDKKNRAANNGGMARKSPGGASATNNNNPDHQSFDNMYKLLLQYKNQNGHLLVPTRHAANGLGPWVSNTRNAYRRQQQKGTTMSPIKQEQIERLNQIGFVWDAAFARGLRGVDRSQATHKSAVMSSAAAATIPKPPPKKRTRYSSVQSVALHHDGTSIPGEDDRRELLKSYLRDFDNVLTNEQVVTLTSATNGWSESEIWSLIQKAAMAPVREYLNAARLRREQLQETRGTLPVLVVGSSQGVNGNGGEEEPNLRNVEMADFDEALASVKPKADSVHSSRTDYRDCP